MDPISVSPEKPAIVEQQQTSDNPAAPSFSDVLSGQPSTPLPDSVTNPNPQSPTLAAPPKPGLWRQVVTGALSGLAGSAGSKSFGGGLAAGAAGELDQQRYERAKQIADANTQSEIRFRDFQAANLAVEAHINDAKLAALPQQLQDQHTAANLELMQQLGTMGLRPVGVVPNTHENVIAGMQQISQSHNGVPSLLTVNLGDKVVAYDLNQLAEGNNDSTLALINKYGPILGRPEITASQWATMPTKDRVDLIHSSVDSLNIVPDPKNVVGQVATAQNRLATYQALPEGKQDPTITKRLQQNVTMLQSAQKQFDAHEVNQKAAVAGAEERAKTAAQTAGVPEVLQKDALGFQPKLPVGGVKEYAKARASFKKNADDLAGTEQTFQQFGQILDDANSGKDLTGAESVVALFNAIGISAEPLKGKGFRINQSTVEEHANARGLGESLYQKLLRLKTGDVVTAQQVKDYATIADQARTNKYVSLVNEAHNAGLNADFLLPNGNGRKLDSGTAKIFLTLGGGNKDVARSAAAKKGWSL